MREFKKGDKVSHPVYGPGRVVEIPSCSSDADIPKVIVVFDNGVRQTLALQYAPLEILPPEEKPAETTAEIPSEEQLPKSGPRGRIRVLNSIARSIAYKFYMSSNNFASMAYINKTPEVKINLLTGCIEPEVFRIGRNISFVGSCVDNLSYLLTKPGMERIKVREAELVAQFDISTPLFGENKDYLKAIFTLTLITDAGRKFIGVEKHDIWVWDKGSRGLDWWKDLLLKSERPSVVLRELQAFGGLINQPELAALVGCRQDPVWHPEGDVWEHTLLCLDYFAARRIKMGNEDYIVGLAVLCHDLGKPIVSREVDGHISSIRHETAGEAPARSFMDSIGVAHEDIEHVIPLIRCHMRLEQLYNVKAGDSAVRRLARDVGGDLDRLIRVCLVDKGGRGQPGTTVFPAGEWLLERYRQLKLKP